MTDISKEISDFSPEQLALLKEAFKQAGLEAPLLPIVSRVKDRSEFPLSFAQQRLWYLDQLYPGDIAYNMPIAVRLKGRLDVAALERSFREIERRHLILRTTFAIKNGTPVQVVSACRDSVVNLVDLTGLGAKSEERAAELVAEEAAEPFDLSRGPLLRVKLLQLGAEDHILMMTMHHIISDGWSTNVLIRELTALYEAYSRGKPSPLEELPIQYADYAVWQRERLQEEEVFEEELDYWRRQLGDAVSVLALPTTTTRAAMQTSRGASHTTELPVKLSESLRELSQRQGVTLFMTLLAAYNVLLYRYSGQRDICVGSAIANRNRAEFEDLIGFFVNTLVFRTQLRADQSFLEVLNQVREATLAAHAHQELPFERIVEELVPDRFSSRSPLFQVMFNLQNAAPQTLTFDGLALGPAGARVKTAKIELILTITESNQGFLVTMEYSTDLFEAETIERLLDHFKTLLAGIVAHPEAKVSTLPLLSEQERDQIVYDWNETISDYPRAQCVHQLFEAQVAQRPQATAVICGARQLSYEELNERANQLAHRLQSLGVSAESRVGICVERSEWLIIGLLGILKAGGAYVSLDPQHPAARLSYMLADAGARVLLTESRLNERLRLGDEALKTISLDSDWTELGAEARTNPVSPVSATNLAFLIYTSGSTGQPKGIGIAHYSVNRLVCNTNYFQIEAEDCVAQASNASFDAATIEIWGALLNGARLCIMPAAVVLSPAEFATELQQQQVTVLFLTTALFHQMAREAVEALLGLRCLMFGGQAVEPQWAARVLAAGYSGRLLNLYGPAENTTLGSWELVREVPAGARSIPIGKPVANTTQYVLGAGMEVLPVGVVGELYLGGDGLARGYWQRPEQTAERFVPDPFSRVGGERLYQTGDLVRGIGEGRVEFVGRVDQQVKIRGFRVELDEIGVVLSGAPGVATAVVKVRERKGREPQLVGYVAGKGGAAPVASELRAYLQERLPGYMVPSVFVTLSELPLTAHGKVDRGALHHPEEGTSGHGEYVSPRTATEEIVAGLWAEVLKVKRVGVTENFFEIGGHSLLATQVMSRIRESFGVELALRELFEQRTVAGLAARVDEALQSGARVLAPPIVPVDHSKPLPLSFAQQRLWFLDQLEPESAFYNIPSAVRLEGKLNREALARSLSEIVRRHEALRTVFASVEGEPVQMIQAAAPVEIEELDLSGLESEERERRAAEFATAEAQTPFDLSRGPLLRVKLLRLGVEEHALLITMHHIISDGWSMGILIRELTSLYAAYSRGAESPLEELPIQYADYAAWQRNWLQGEVLERQLDYWRGQLADAPSFLELPTDKARPAVQSLRGSAQLRILDQSLSDQIKTLSQHQGVTLFMTLLTAYNVLLYRYSGQRDICVGSPIANRNRAEIEGLVGFFINTLVLRTKLFDDCSVTELLKRVRETTLDAYAHQDISFDQLVEALVPERALSHTPLFQVMFAVQNVPTQQLKLEGLTLGAVDMDSGIAKYDLILSMLETELGLAATVQYSTDLFEQETIERLMDHFERLLAGIVANPEEKVSLLPLLSEAERAQIVYGWNETAREFPREQCIQQLFEAQVERTPSVSAVISGERELSYEELNERANQLAHWLRAQGVRAESRVGICLERSEWLIVGLLGILKAGGTYVPLDPQYPAARLSYMLADAGVSVLLTESSLRQTLALAGEIKTLCLDSEWDELAAQPRTNPESVFNAANLAYLIYTSGSTGEPKGIGIAHYSVNRLVCNSDYVQVQADDCIAQASNASFDAATFEIWGALLNGARLSIIPTAVVLSPVEFAAALQREKVTVLFLTTALFNQMAREAVTGFSGLRHLLFGGQAVEPQWVAQVLESGYAGRLLHVYGPTESTTYATWEEVKEVKEGTRSIPIGKPLANTTQYVLGPGMEVAPVGVVGELYLGGEGLARGYWERPELTAERFVPNPYSRTGGERLYRTGDLVRGVGDGRVEFVGRVDQQVKIRGFRVELEEVGVVLSSAPGVATAVVEVRGREGGEPRLVGYVVPKGEAALVVNELREYLQERLPAYMVPSVYVELSELPLTVNGKVDRRALPEPEEWSSGGSEYVAPRTATEEIVAGIWASVLKVERVGVTENFFEIGGHSLLATQVMSRLRESFGLELALRELFEHATVAGLAARVDEALHSGAGVLAPPIVPVDHNKPLPLSFAQQRLWFFDQLEPESTFYNIPTAVRLSGALNPEALGRSLSEIVRRHEVLRTVFANVEGEPVQVIRAAEPVAIDETDLSGLAKEEREARAEEFATLETQIPFDLSSGPLLRVKLLKLDVEDHVLLLTIHHIVFDGWSNGVFTAELMALYEAYSGGAESPLEDLPIQYADYAVWQRSWLQGETLQKQIEYWRKKLEGAPAALNLPLDRPRPTTPTHRGATTPVSLSPEHSDMLRTLSQRNGVTLFMTLVTALNVLLRHHSGQEDILIGSNVANRNHSNTEKLIGFFINQVVLRFDLSGDPTFQELLTRVRDVMLGAYAHQDLPFEKLVEELQPARSAGHSLLFQVKVDMYAPTSAQRQATGPRISVMEPRHNIARYDLQMSFLDTRPSLQGSLIYSTDIFEAATMAHYAKQLQSILTTVIERTEIRLSELDEILTKSDEQEALEREQRVEEASLRKLKAIGQRRSS